MNPRTSVVRTVTPHAATEPAPPMRAPRARPEGGYDTLPSDPKGLLRLLLRTWWMPALGVLLAGGAAYAWVSRQPMRYMSSATIQLLDSRLSIGARLDGGGSSAPEQSVRTQVAILRSRPLAGAVVDSQPLGLRVLPQGMPWGMVQEVAVAGNSADGGVLTLAFDGGSWFVTDDSVRYPYDEPITVRGLTLRLDRPPVGVTRGRLLILPRDMAIDRLLSQLVVNEREMTTLIDVRFTADEPQVALQALGALVQAYQRADAATAQLQARRRREVVQQQLEAVNAQLSGAERQQGVSSDERMATRRAEVRLVEQKQQELRTERQVVSDLRARFDSPDPAVRARALLALPGTPVGSAPGVAALFTELSQREVARAEMTSGPRGLPARHPDVQRADQLVEGAKRRLVGAVQAYEEGLLQRLAALDKQKTELSRDLQGSPVVKAQEVLLAQSANALREQAAGLRAEFQRAQVAEAAAVGQVDIVEPPSRVLPLRPPVGRLVVFALGLGALCGVMAAVLREALDRTVKGRHSVERGLRLPLLGTIPRITGTTAAISRWQRRGTPKVSEVGRRRSVALATARDLRSGESEAFRQLRTQLLYALGGRGKSLLVTSTRPAEGKTSVSVNLAISIAQQRLRVLLIDCDFVAGRLHVLLGANATPGLQQVLGELSSPFGAVQGTLVSGLWLISAGAGGADLIDPAGSQRFRTLLRELTAVYDVVILDSAPLLAVADSVAMSVAADGVLVVTRAGETRIDEADEALRQLDAVNANVLGAVINDVDNRLPRYGEGTYAYRGYYAAVSAGEAGD